MLNEPQENRARAAGETIGQGAATGGKRERVAPFLRKTPADPRCPICGSEAPKAPDPYLRRCCGQDFCTIDLWERQEAFFQAAGMSGNLSLRDAHLLHLVEAVLSGIFTREQIALPTTPAYVRESGVLDRVFALREKASKGVILQNQLVGATQELDSARTWGHQLHRRLGTVAAILNGIYTAAEIAGMPEELRTCPAVQNALKVRTQLREIIGRVEKLEGVTVTIDPRPAVCPVCCRSAVEGGAARPGEICQGCGFQPADEAGTVREARAEVAEYYAGPPPFTAQDLEGMKSSPPDTASTSLAGDDVECLKQMLVVTWDGNLISKSARDRLVKAGLATRAEGGNVITAAGLQMLRMLTQLPDLSGLAGWYTNREIQRLREEAVAGEKKAAELLAKLEKIRTAFRGLDEALCG
jgi:hypothetical protein